MKYRFILLLLVFTFHLSPFTLQAQTVSGTVTDKGTGETLIGATVLDMATGKGTVTNAYGRYTLTLKSDAADLKVSFIGYSPQYFRVDLKSDVKLNVALESALELEEVTITAERISSPKVSQMSAIEVPVEQIKLVPVMFGEADVLKAIQLLPGVQSGTEGTSGIYVRGGGPDENLFLLDGIPLYNVNHLGGFFSAFNSDALKNVTLYKGSFPAHFTGRISSVLDITTNNGNDKEWHGSGSIGLLAAKLSVEGPIIKEKTTVGPPYLRRRPYPAHPDAGSHAGGRYETTQCRILLLRPQCQVDAPLQRPQSPVWHLLYGRRQGVSAHQDWREWRRQLQRVVETGLQLGQPGHRRAVELRVDAQAVHEPLGLIYALPQRP